MQKLCPAVAMKGHACLWPQNKVKNTRFHVDTCLWSRCLCSLQKRCRTLFKTRTNKASLDNTWLKKSWIKSRWSLTFTHNRCWLLIIPTYMMCAHKWIIKYGRILKLRWKKVSTLSGLNSLRSLDWTFTGSVTFLHTSRQTAVKQRFYRKSQKSFFSLLCLCVFSLFSVSANFL